MGLLGPMPRRKAAWEKTRWSLVGQLEPWEEGASEAAWVHLVDAYRPPMVAYAHAYLARRGGGILGPGDAEELVDSFLAKCLEKGWLATAQPDRGPFRAFVQVTLRRHLSNAVRAAATQKRRPQSGAPRDLGELTEHGAEPESEARLDAELDRQWTEAIVLRAIEGLDALAPHEAHLIRELIRLGGDVGADAAAVFNVHPANFAVFKHRARKRFKDLFVEQLTATVNDAKEFEAEWTRLEPYMP